MIFLRLSRAIAAGLALLCLAGCLETLKLTSTPSGASVAVDAKPVGTTPLDVPLEQRTQPYQLTVSKAGYQTELVSFETGKGRKALDVALSPLSEVHRFALRSEPSGATITLGDRTLGKTPCEVELTFVRSDKAQPWQPIALTVGLKDYESETLTLRAESPGAPEPVALTLLRAEKTYAVSANWAGQGSELKASLKLKDSMLPQTTPSEVRIVYQRAHKQDAWPTFPLVAEVASRFKPSTVTLTFDSPLNQNFQLEPVTEVPVSRASPQVVIDPNTGAVLRVVTEDRLGQIDIGEHGTELSGLTRITDFRRRDNTPNAPVQILTSFALVPKGDAAVLAIATLDPRGDFVSGLRLVRTDGSFTPAMLTDGSRYFDTAPAFSRYEQGILTLVFQSNRADRSKPDIFRLSIDEKNYGPVGGIARITSDQRFNYAPTFADTAIGIVYLSVEPNYPLAKPQLSTVKADGVLPTQFPITALEVAQREMSTIYFVREDPSSRKKQIFSVQPDGKLETALINDAALASADCTHPSPSFVKDGRLLFVSNAGLNEKGRPQNDIYVMNADGTNVQRLTTNGSDDILPAWSPADNEPGVFYFVSNRGGAYNLWRARIAEAH